MRIFWAHHLNFLIRDDTAQALRSGTVVSHDKKMGNLEGLSIDILHETANPGYTEDDLTKFRPFPRNSLSTWYKTDMSPGLEISFFFYQDT